MQLIKFLVAHAGHNEGTYQYYDEITARQLIEGGVAVDAYASREEPVKMEYREKEEDKEEQKQVDAPPRDKMLRRPVKKK